MLVIYNAFTINRWAYLVCFILNAVLPVAKDTVDLKSKDRPEDSRLRIASVDPMRNHQHGPMMQALLWLSPRKTEVACDPRFLRHTIVGFYLPTKLWQTFDHP